MTGSLSPEQRQLLMAGYALYNLSAEEAASLEVLLAENPDLCEELDQLQATWEMACDIVPQAPRLTCARLFCKPLLSAQISAQIPAFQRAHRPLPPAQIQPQILWWLAPGGGEDWE